MSDTILKLIPVDPKFIPTTESQTEVAAVLRALLPHAEEIKSIVFNGVQFVDPGGNLEKITCPECGKPIENAVWQKMMSERFETQNGFLNLEIRLPCCGGLSSLNDLVYSWQAGFASYVLEIRNPEGDLESAELKQLEVVVGCNLKKIQAQY